MEPSELYDETHIYRDLPGASRHKRQAAFGESAAVVEAQQSVKSDCYIRRKDSPLQSKPEQIIQHSYWCGDYCPKVK